MPKSEGAVIPMPQNFNDLTYVVGNEQTFLEMQQIPAMQVFDEKAIAFLNALSALLMKKGRDYSDIMTFAFWCRKASLLQEKAKYDDIPRRLGKGIVFHSTPSNVAVNFAFSFAAGMLSGNANIIRLPAKSFAQVDIICEAVNELLENGFSSMKPYILMVKFPTVKEIMDVFSAAADARVIWGGDQTIFHVRQSPLKPRANEITFADRHSLLVIDADAYLAADAKERIIQDFYNDTYFSDQNACTAPRIIFWKGVNISAAKKDFWGRVAQKAGKEYNLTAVQAVGKLANFYKSAACLDIAKTATPDNFVTRVQIRQLEPSVLDYKYNSGFFFEYDIQDLTEMLPVCNDKCQTITYFGIGKDDISHFIASAPHGVDRIVPMGKSMDFTLIWDGHDLIRELSRIICVL